MKASEFRSLLLSCQLRQKDAGWLMGVHPRQVRSWVLGEYPVPPYASLILLAYSQGLLPDKWLVKTLGEPPP